MWNYYWPIILIVTSNAFYHICSKSTPKGANTFLSLLVTYLVAAASCLVFYLITCQSKNFLSEVKILNWSSIALGLSIVCLEFGFIEMYRVGWDISIGPLIANIGLAILLILIGFILYHEHLTIYQIIGVVLCVAGLIFINK